ncbi:MAG: hypothetical protein LBJ47_04275 [Tannerella sp.]|jgi:hypothetical protein|nr:hypothetical protein [Tannerella sp.]
MKRNRDKHKRQQNVEQKVDKCLSCKIDEFANFYLGLRPENIDDDTIISDGDTEQLLIALGYLHFIQEEIERINNSKIEGILGNKQEQTRLLKYIQGEEFTGEKAHRRYRQKARESLAKYRKNSSCYGHRTRLLKKVLQFCFATVLRGIITALVVPILVILLKEFYAFLTP